MRSQERAWVGWYYQRGGRQIGPVPRSKIVQLITGGQLPRSEQVWRAWNDNDEFRLDPIDAETAVSGERHGPPAGVPPRWLGTSFPRSELLGCVN
jgi:hypothetical protein